MPGFSTIFATLINPVFLILLLLSGFVGRMAMPPPRFWMMTVLGIGLSTGLAELGKAIPIWHGHASFPSGHETFGLACGTCLIFADVRWAWVAVPLAIALGFALVMAKFHDVSDVFGALLTGPLPVWAVQRLICHSAKS